LLLLLLGRKGISVGGFAPDHAPGSVGENEVRRCPRDRLIAVIETLNPATSARPGFEALRFPYRRKSGVWYSVWKDEQLALHPPTAEAGAEA